MLIPFNIPYSTGKEEGYILRALQSQAHCGNRQFTEKCRELLLEKYGFRHVYLTPSCTSAMEMGALLADLHPGDEVILPSYTFSSTANAVVLRGAKPVFCEVEPDTMNLDVNLLEVLITERTRLICPIDYAGIPCEIDKIMSIAGKYDLPVMEDAAQSFDSYYKDIPCGGWADFTAFSFHETKNTSCGEGGGLVIKDEKYIDRAAVLQEKGTDRSYVLKGLQKDYSWVDLGSSFLLADILAAMLLAQFESAEEIRGKREKIWFAYRDLFKPYAETGYVKIPRVSEYVRHNYHAFFVIFDNNKNRNLFIDLLKKEEVFVYIGYKPLHSSIYGRKFGYRPEDLPLTEDYASRIVRLPFYTAMADDGLDYCLEKMEQVLQGMYGKS